MTPNSAWKFVPIVSNTDYSPSAQTIEYKDPNTGVGTGIFNQNGMTPPIYALLCTDSTADATTITIQALGDAAATTVKASSFVPGVVYYIYLKKIVGTAVKFIGFQYPSTPLVF